MRVVRPRALQELPIEWGRAQSVIPKSQHAYLLGRSQLTHVVRNKAWVPWAWGMTATMATLATMRTSAYVSLRVNVWECRFVHRSRQRLANVQGRANILSRAAVVVLIFDVSSEAL